MNYFNLLVFDRNLHERMFCMCKLFIQVTVSDLVLVSIIIVIYYVCVSVSDANAHVNTFFHTEVFMKKLLRDQKDISVKSHTKTMAKDHYISFILEKLSI